MNSKRDDPLYMLPQGTRPSDRLKERCSDRSMVLYTSRRVHQRYKLSIFEREMIQFGEHHLDIKTMEELNKMWYGILLYNKCIPNILCVFRNNPHYPLLKCAPFLSKSFGITVLDPTVTSHAKYEPKALPPNSTVEKSYSPMRLRDWKPTGDQSNSCFVMLALWHAKKYEQIMNMVAAAANDQSPELIINSLGYLICTFEERMHTFDLVQKGAFKFLAALYAFAKGQIFQGHTLISRSLFYPLPKPMRNEALTILSTMASKYPATLSIRLELKPMTLESIAGSCNEFPSPGSKLSLLIPKVEELDPPVQVSSSLSSNFLKSENYNCYIREQEEKILRKARDKRLSEEEVGNSYVDLMQSCPLYKLQNMIYAKEFVLSKEEKVALKQDHLKFGIDVNAMRAGCLLLGALWFLKKLRRLNKSKQHRRASKNPACSKNEVSTLLRKIHICLEDAFALAQSKHMHPGMKLYISRMCAGTKLASIRCAKESVTEDDIKLLSTSLKTLDEICCFTPFWFAPPTSVYECSLLEYYLGKLHSKFIFHLQNLPRENNVVPQKKLCHQLYENHYTSLCPVTNPNKVWLEALEMALKEKGQTLSDVARLLSSPLTPCDADGWANHSSDSHNECMKFTSVVACCLDINAHCLYIDCQKVPPGKGTFSKYDLHTVLDALLTMENPMSLTFSLDPIEGEQYSLLQQIVYNPLDLEDSPILQVMCEADYLLKEITTNSEISRKPPFHQRSCTEGLIKYLPAHLRKGLTVSYSDSRFSSHRFWIKAEEICCTIVSSEKIADIEVKMVVHHHPQKVCADGRRCDTEQDDPNSIESKFAAFFTNHYDELSTYFPVLARLKELCKLQLLAKIVQEKMPKFSHDRKQMRKSTQKQCTRYVPSTFFRGTKYRCTGGVVLQPKQQCDYVCGKCCSTAPTSPLMVTPATRRVDQLLHEDKPPTHRLRAEGSGDSVRNADKLMQKDTSSITTRMNTSPRNSSATQGVDKMLQSTDHSRGSFRDSLPTQRVDKLITNENMHHQRLERAQGHSLQAIKGVDQLMRDNPSFHHRRPTCKYCSGPLDPDPEPSMYPKGVKLAPMITISDSSNSYDTATPQVDGNRVSICINLGKSVPTSEELKSIQPEAQQFTFERNSTDLPRNSFQPLKSTDQDLDTPDFMIDYDKWQHLF